MKPQIRTKSAHTITTIWRPARYPVNWVDRPEDVPPWDPTRGGDKSGFRFPKDSETYEQNLERFGEKREILEPPDGYPRLVRTDWTTMLPYRPLGDDLVNLLANLIPPNRCTPIEQITHTDTFKQNVIRIAESYGPYAPDDPGNASDWVFIATIAAAHLDFLECLNDTGKIADIYSNLCERWGIKLQKDTATSPGWLAYWSYLKVFSAYPVQIAREDGINESREYRKIAAEHLRGRFSSYMESEGVMKFKPADSQIELHLGINGWLEWELATLYDSYIPIKKCPGCGRTFEARGKRKWCEPNTSSCRMKLNRRASMHNRN